MHHDGDGSRRGVSCCHIVLEAIVAVAAVMIAAYGVVQPVRFTVRDVSAARVAPAGANGTALAYDAALTVAVSNVNWAMRTELAAPLDAELRLAGRRLAGAPLLPAAAAGEGRRRVVEPWESGEFRVTAAGEREIAELAAAEWWESPLELVLAGEVRYRPVHRGTYSLALRCPLKEQTAAPAGAGMAVHDNVIKCYSY
ncbi:hypothetical protein ACP4OV_010261 [Aristida adscensionis]